MIASSNSIHRPTLPALVFLNRCAMLRDAIRSTQPRHEKTAACEADDKRDDNHDALRSNKISATVNFSAAATLARVKSACLA